ncbi:hypothetical protein [Propionibacterium sp.]|uniref:hypothetical protein n=1 Tax=Propionibacterium sp. TaxID=1977903 RepID=UPI00345EEE76
MIATDADNRDATHIGAAWRLTRTLSPRPQVRAASGDQVNAYPTQVPVAGPAPAGPWAMYLTDAQRRYRYIGLDLDAHEGGAPQASRDATAIATVLDQAGIEHVICESGPTGGRHVWVALAETADPQLVRHLTHSLQGLATSLDPTPLLNPTTGCLRPPDAPHRHGGASRVIAGDLATLRHPTTTPAQLVALATRLNEEFGDVATVTSLPHAAELRVPVDEDGRPWLPGPRRAMPAKSRAAVDEDAAASEDASRVLYVILLGAAAAHWHYRDAAALVATAPGMEYARTQRARHGGRARQARPPHGAQSSEAALGRVWQAAVRFVATHARQAGDDPTFDPRAEAIAATVDQVQRRADAAPGRWTRGGGPADRRVLDALCLLALQAVSAAVEADVRRLALLAGIGRETARTALLRLAGDGWINQAQAGAGRHATTWTIEPQTAIHMDADHARSQGAARPAGAGSRWRHLLLDELPPRLDLARHDTFTNPHALGLAAGNLYARLNSPHQVTTTEITPLLDRLAHAGLIVATPTGWRRTRPEIRDLAARRLGVEGRLDAREGRYKAERDLWEWWQSELEWMTTPGRHKRRRQPTGQMALTFGRPWDIYPPYPRRADGRADHRAARAMINAGALDHLHQILATAA